MTPFNDHRIPLFLKRAPITFLQALSTCAPDFGNPSASNCGSSRWSSLFNRQIVGRLRRAELAQAIVHRLQLTSQQLVFQDREFTSCRTFFRVMLETGLVEVFAHMVDVQNACRVRMMRQRQAFDPRSGVADHRLAVGLVEAYTCAVTPLVLSETRLRNHTHTRPPSGTAAH